MLCCVWMNVMWDNVHYNRCVAQMWAVSFFPLPPPPKKKCQCIVLCCTVFLLTIFYWLMWWCKSSMKSCYSAGEAHLYWRAHEGSLPCSYKLSIVFYCHPVESIPVFTFCVFIILYNFIPVFVCRSLKWSVFLRFSSQYFVCNTKFFHTVVLFNTDSKAV
jgi:hypothetical protein